MKIEHLSFLALTVLVQCHMPPRWKEKPEYRSTDLAFVLALRLIVTSSQILGHQFSHL